MQTRRDMLTRSASVAAALAGLGLLPQAAQAAWPQSPVSVVLGFSAGSGVDIVARAIQEPLSKLLGQPVVVDYKTGAGGNIASRAVAAAAPDGYTLALGTAASHGDTSFLDRARQQDGVVRDARSKTSARPRHE